MARRGPLGRDYPPHAVHQEILRSVSLFEELSEVALASLAALCREQRHAAGEHVFREGDPADAFYVVADGQVAVYRDAPGKPVLQRMRAERGDFFGEMGLFDDAPRSASARAVGEVVLLRIDKRELLRFLVANPTLSFRLRMEMARRHGDNAAAALDLGRRAELRIRVDQPVWLTLDDGQRVEARLENLSVGGMCLSGAPATWQTHQAVRFGVGEPGHRPLLEVNGRVAWREARSIGVAFRVDSADHDRQIQMALRELLR